MKSKQPLHLYLLNTIVRSKELVPAPSQLVEKCHNSLHLHGLKLLPSTSSETMLI
jgi:hypothetical protein